MTKHILLPLALLLAVLLGAPPLRAQPDTNREGTRWMLDLEHGPLKIAGVRDPVGIKNYHYITLKVTNPGDLPRDWRPVVTAITDTGKTYVAMGFDEALPAIRAQEDDDDLVAIGTTPAKIQPGETFDTVAIFGPMDPEYDRVQVRLLGLVDPIAIYKAEVYDVPVEVPGVQYLMATGDGDFDAMENAVFIQDVGYVERNRKMMAALRKEIGDGEMPDPTVEYWEVSERRVFEMVYSRPGDEFRPDDDLISFVDEQWRVIGDVKILRKIQM